MIAATHGSRRRGKKKGAQNNRDCVSPSQHLTDTFLCQRTQRGKKVAQKNTDCVSPSQYLMETFLYQRTLWGKKGAQKKTECQSPSQYLTDTPLCQTTQRQSCQPLLGVNLSPEFVNLYFPYAGQGLLFFDRWQWHFEFQMACVAVEVGSNIV